jgi:hypothetical protein
MDHPLPFGKKCGLRLHLLICRWCRRYGKQLQFLRQASRCEPGSTPGKHSPELSPEAKERLKRILQKEQ